MFLLDNSDFQFSVPQYLTHYTAKGNGDILDILVHGNVQLSDATESDALKSDHLPIVCQDHIRIKDISDSVENHTDWERFRSLDCD